MLTPRYMRKTKRSTGGLQWSEDITRMVLEMLSHRTPPSCIAPNILTVARTIYPNRDIVFELPGVSFIRHCRSVLSYLTKLLAAFLLAKAPKYLEFHLDGTSRRQITMNNAIVRIAILGGFRNICLNSAILSEDETSAMLTQTMLRTFREAKHILKSWHRVTEREYPDRDDLKQLLPPITEMSVAKLAKGGWTMTDTCSPMLLFRKLWTKAVVEVAKAEGMEDHEIAIYEAGK